MNPYRYVMHSPMQRNNTYAIIMIYRMISDKSTLLNCYFTFKIRMKKTEKIKYNNIMYIIIIINDYLIYIILL